MAPTEVLNAVGAPRSVGRPERRLGGPIYFPSHYTLSSGRADSNTPC